MQQSVTIVLTVIFFFTLLQDNHHPVRIGVTAAQLQNDQVLSFVGTSAYCSNTSVAHVFIHTSGNDDGPAMIDGLYRLGHGRLESILVGGDTVLNSAGDDLLLSKFPAFLRVLTSSSGHIAAIAMVADCKIADYPCMSLIRTSHDGRRGSPVWTGMEVSIDDVTVVVGQFIPQSLSMNIHGDIAFMTTIYKEFPGHHNGADPAHAIWLLDRNDTLHHVLGLVDTGDAHNAEYLTPILDLKAPATALSSDGAVAFTAKSYVNNDAHGPTLTPVVGLYRDGNLSIIAYESMRPRPAEEFMFRGSFDHLRFLNDDELVFTATMWPDTNHVNRDRESRARRLLQAKATAWIATSDGDLRRIFLPEPEWAGRQGHLIDCQNIIVQPDGSAMLFCVYRLPDRRTETAVLRRFRGSWHVALRTGDVIEVPFLAGMVRSIGAVTMTSNSNLIVEVSVTNGGRDESNTALCHIDRNGTLTVLIYVGQVLEGGRIDQLSLCSNSFVMSESTLCSDKFVIACALVDAEEGDEALESHLYLVPLPAQPRTNPMNPP